MRILGLERSQGACNQYRIVQPLYKLHQHKLADILTIHPDNAGDMDFITEKIIEAEIILFQRPTDESWLNFIKIARKYGKLIVADYDDDPFNTSPWNPAYRFYGVANVYHKTDMGDTIPLWEAGQEGFSIEDNIRRRDCFRASFKKCDMVSCTTPILAETFKKINKNTAVLPNALDFDLFPQVEMVKKEIRIGWQGGSSHYEDLYMVSKAIKAILKKHDNVKFIFFGDMRFYGLFKDIPEDKIEWHSWLSFKAYPYKLACLNIDIGLCPIVDNIFNRNKSAIKYFEYSAMRIATIASNIPPYTEVMTAGENGLLVSDDQWFMAMEDMIGDVEKRRKLADKAYDNVFENHNADKKVHLWRDTYESLLKKDVAKMVEV